MDIEQQAGQTAGRSVWRAVVYLLAIVLIGLGLWSLGGAIYAAWELFREHNWVYDTFHSQAGSNWIRTPW
mgnify:CR=1 FL=1